MNQTLKRIISMVMTFVMLLSLSSIAFAGGSIQPVTGNPARLILVDDTVDVVLYPSGYDLANPNFNAEEHTYTAIKILDLVAVKELDVNVTLRRATAPTYDQQSDEDGNVVYMYTLPEENALGNIGDVLTDAGFAFVEHSVHQYDDGYEYDVPVCEITMANGDEITSMTGINENTSNAAKLATALVHAAIDDGLTGTEMELGVSYPLECGYYVIYQSSETCTEGFAEGLVATKPLLVDVRPQEGDNPLISVTLKDATVSFCEEIIDSNGVGHKQYHAAIGEKVKKRGTTNFPIYEANVPELDMGFDEDEGFENIGFFINFYEPGDVELSSITVTVNGNTVQEGAETYTIVSATEEGALDEVWYYQKLTAFSVCFVSDYILEHQGESIVVEFNNILAEDSIIYTNESTECYGNIGQSRVVFIYSPEIMNTSEIYDYTCLYTYGFLLDKLDGNTESLMDGVVFELYKDGETDPITFNINTDLPLAHSIEPYEHYVVDASGNGSVDYITTSDEDCILIIGLDSGDYRLHEVSTLPGYSLLGDDIIIHIDDDVEVGVHELDGVDLGTDDLMTGGATISVEGFASMIDIYDWEEGDPEVSSVDNDADYEKNDSHYGSTRALIFIRNFVGVSLPSTGSFAAIAMSVAGAITTLGGCAFLVKKKKNDD